VYGLGPMNRDHGLKCHLGHAGMSAIFYVLLSCVGGGFHMVRYQVQEVASMFEGFEVSDLAYT
jgi:hypothetical protein